MTGNLVQHDILFVVLPVLLKKLTINITSLLEIMYLLSCLLDKPDITARYATLYDDIS